MKVRSSTWATSLGEERGVETARPELLVEAKEGAGGDQLIAQAVVLGPGPVHPVDRGRLRQIRHLLHPPDQVLIGRGRLLQAAMSRLHR